MRAQTHIITVIRIRNFGKKTSTFSPSRYRARAGASSPCAWDLGRWPTCFTCLGPTRAVEQKTPNGATERAHMCVKYAGWKRAPGPSARTCLFRPEAGGEIGWRRLRRFGGGFSLGFGRWLGQRLWLAEPFAGFFGGGDLRILSDDAAEQNSSLFGLVQFAGIEIGKVNCRPAPAFRRKIFLQDFLIFQGSRDVIAQVLFVDLSDAQ